MYFEEKDYIISEINKAIALYCDKTAETVEQKSEFDLVTEIDKNIESYLINAIKSKYPDDNVLSEETLYNAEVIGRTWTIDPIDGTCNMAHGMRIFGVQCCLIDNDELSMSVVILPRLDEEYYAIRGHGTYFNGIKQHVSSNNAINNSIISTGDFSHRATDLGLQQYKAVGYLYPRVSKIRTFGAACVDFSYMASGKTDATVILTTNLWDLLPGMLLCSEAGAIVTNTKNEKFRFGDAGAVASANPQLHDLMITALNL